MADLGPGSASAGPRLVAAACGCAGPAAPELELDERARAARVVARLAARARRSARRASRRRRARGAACVGAAIGFAGEWSERGRSTPCPGRSSARMAPLARPALDATSSWRGSDGAWAGRSSSAGGEGSVDLPGPARRGPVRRARGAARRLARARALLERPPRGPARHGQRRRARPAAAGGAFAAWPLDLDVELDRCDPALRGYLAPPGDPARRRRPRAAARQRLAGELPTSSGPR